MKKLTTTIVILAFSLLSISARADTEVATVTAVEVNGKILKGDLWTKKQVLLSWGKPVKVREPTKECGTRFDEGNEEVYSNNLVLEADKDRRTIFELKFLNPKNAIYINGTKLNNKMTKGVFFDKFKSYLPYPNPRESQFILNTNDPVEYGGYKFSFKNGLLFSVISFYQC